MLDFILRFWEKYKYKLIICILFILSLCINVFSIKSCSNYRDLNTHNIESLSDSIHYYRSKNGELVASKKLLEGDLSTIKIVNDSLYRAIKNMKISNPSTVVSIKTTVDNVPQDTLWNTDTIIQNLNIERSFAFNNEYRSLEGKISVNDSTLGLNIQKDQTYVDYILAVENSTVVIKSSNPYVKLTEIEGITIPKQKHKNWGLTVGPAIFTGINTSRKFTVGAGVSVVWGYRIK